MARFAMAKDAKLEELEKRNIGSLLLSYSLPAIVGMVATSVYNIVDAIYVGQWCGALAIAGMALVFPVMNLTVAVGTLVAFAVSLVAIRFLVRFVQRHDFVPFGVYRILLGLAVLAWYFTH